MKSTIKARSYQESIFANSMNKNSLVVLPTGLGKTLVALMLIVYYINKTQKKVLFLAPTKPLVEQQQKVFEDSIQEKEINSILLTGLVSPKKRVLLYQESNIIFSTPQLIENDIVNELVDPKEFALVIFDEAHRATGNYAYTFIAEQFSKTSSKILALTASPGTSKQVIEEVMEKLYIEHLEYKTYQDEDVKEYVQAKEIKKITVELPEELLEIKVLLNEVYVKQLNKLKELGYFKGKPLKGISKTDLLAVQALLRTQIGKGESHEEVWRAISISAGLMKLSYGIELFESQEVSAAHSYFYNLFREGGDSSKAALDLTSSINFREAFDKISKLKREGIIHPKLKKLKEVVREELKINKDLRIIVFNQYRETASKLVQELNSIKEIKTSLFVGQAKKGDVKMSQKDQKKILEQFKKGEYNVLVSTSVGEEGLDIPKVDVVVFYEPVGSAIRMIQRIGRTGRFKKGLAYMLMTKDSRDIIANYASSAKEKRMYKVLDEIKTNMDKKDRTPTLDKFVNSTEDKKGLSKKCETLAVGALQQKHDERILIYVDGRENSDLLKELFRLNELKPVKKQLEVGDIVISEDIAIERKSKKDFVDSLLDKRLFPQLISLAKSYRRPILIVEGEGSIYTQRNVRSSAIRAALSAIAVDMRIPILFTESMYDTSQLILTIAKRTVRVKKEISLAEDKKAFSEEEEIEKFVSSIPNVNVVNAKKLLSHFGTIEKLIRAKEKDLLECPGIGQKRAKWLYDFFRRKYKTN